MVGRSGISSCRSMLQLFMKTNSELGCPNAPSIHMKSINCHHTFTNPLAAPVVLRRPTMLLMYMFLSQSCIVLLNSVERAVSCPLRVVVACVLR